VLAAIGQIIGALMFSGAVAFSLGLRIYVVVTLFVFVGCFVLLLDAEYRSRDPEIVAHGGKPRPYWLVLIAIAGTAGIFSSIWPSLPPIWGISSWRTHSRRKVARKPDAVS